jgi:hypothetical protein
MQHPSAAPPAALGPVDPDLHRAEALLHDLALELRRVPLEERTRRLHLRALALKTEVGTWRTTPIDEAARRAVLEELLALNNDARRHRRVRRSGEVLLHARLKKRA